MCDCKFCGCNIPDGHPIATQVTERISAEEASAACEMAQVAVRVYLANCNNTTDPSINIFLDDANVLSATARKYILRSSVQRRTVGILAAKNWQISFSGYCVSVRPILPGKV